MYLNRNRTSDIDKYLIVTSAHVRCSVLLIFINTVEVDHNEETKVRWPEEVVEDNDDHVNR